MKTRHYAKYCASVQSQVKVSTEKKCDRFVMTDHFIY